MYNYGVIVPAYNPDINLIILIKNLLQIEIAFLVVVNDGSKESSREIFEEIKQYGPRVISLEHSINLGKGAALKTGLNYAYAHFPEDIGVVTADADGQHSIADIIRVGEALKNKPKDLIIGVRQFKSTADKPVPWRSRFGNLLTIKLFKLIVGQSISDTQSGLRGIPRAYIPDLLRINNNGYEFELNMLISCKYTNRKISEVSIDTIYIDNNKSSHFNPILDSLKIYFVLLRFALLSFSTFLLDLTVFVTLSHLGFNILSCQLLSRTVGALYNYPLAKNMVFRCSEDQSNSFLKFIALVMINGGISFVIIDFFVFKYAISPVFVKIPVEFVLFLANFTIERDLIFTRKVAYED